MSNATQRAVQIGAEMVRQKVTAENEDQEKRRAMAQKAGAPVPAEDPPRATELRWVQWAARSLKDAEIEDWVTDRDVEEALGESLVAGHLEMLCGLVEFLNLEVAAFDIRWTPKPIAVRDIVSASSKVGRIKVVQLAERLTWQGEDPAPDFRLELSLPFFLLATADEVERGLHDLLSYAAYDDDKPKLRKPDIVANASTLARYGVSSAREAMAVTHALQCDHHKRVARDYGFDAGGQGMLWPPLEPREQNIVDLAADIKRTVKKAGATMHVETNSTEKRPEI